MADSSIAVYLQGGPCDGTTHHYTAGQIKDGIVTCGGVVYRYNGDSHNPLVFVAPVKGQPPDVKESGREADISRDWTRLMHALGRKAPQEVIRARQANARIRRLIRNR